MVKRIPQDGEKVVNDKGGSQSFMLANYIALPAISLRLVAQCFGFCAFKHGLDNWHNIPLDDHLNHAMNHIVEWRNGCRHEMHLVNAAVRLMMAIYVSTKAGLMEEIYHHPDMDAEGESIEDYNDCVIELPECSGCSKTIQGDTIFVMGSAVLCPRCHSAEFKRVLI